MQNYVIATCSTVDISPEYLKERNIDFLKFSYFLDCKEMLDDMGVSITHKEFYDAMRGGADTKTAHNEYF